MPLQSSLLFQVDRELSFWTLSSMRRYWTDPNRWLSESGTAALQKHSLKTQQGHGARRLQLSSDFLSYLHASSHDASRCGINAVPRAGWELRRPFFDVSQRIL